MDSSRWMAATRSGTAAAALANTSPITSSFTTDPLLGNTVLAIQNNDLGYAAVPDPAVVVAIMYPPHWDTRPADELERDVRALTGIDARIEVVDARYVDPDALRTR